jgi:hypothetical protein
MPTTIRYRWRYYDEARRKSFTTSYHCTEEQIRIEHPDAEAIEGSRQELVLCEDPGATSMARFGGAG